MVDKCKEGKGGRGRGMRCLGCIICFANIILGIFGVFGEYLWFCTCQLCSCLFLMLISPFLLRSLYLSLQFSFLGSHMILFISLSNSFFYCPCQFAILDSQSCFNPHFNFNREIQFAIKLANPRLAHFIFKSISRFQLTLILILKLVSSIQFLNLNCVSFHFSKSNQFLDKIKSKSPSQINLCILILKSISVS